MYEKVIISLTESKRNQIISIYNHYTMENEKPQHLSLVTVWKNGNMAAGGNRHKYWPKLFFLVIFPGQ